MRDHQKQNACRGMCAPVPAADDHQGYRGVWSRREGTSKASSILCPKPRQLRNTPSRPRGISNTTRSPSLQCSRAGKEGQTLAAAPTKAAEQIRTDPRHPEPEDRGFPAACTTVAPLCSLSFLAWISTRPTAPKI